MLAPYDKDFLTKSDEQFNTYITVDGHIVHHKLVNYGNVMLTSLLKTQPYS